MPTATLHLTKLAATKRQLQAAIRLFFMEEDVLAIHTIAAAAYGILKGLKSDRGLNEAADSYLTTLFYLVRDFRRGTLPDNLTSDPVMVAEIERIANQLAEITANSKLSDVQGVTISPDLEKKYWNESNQTANFLKHADRDPDGALPLDKIDHNLMLMKCYSAYLDIAPDDLGNEGLVFAAFTSASNSAYQTSDSAFDALVELIKVVPPRNRRVFCNEVFVEMNKKSGSI